MCCASFGSKALQPSQLGTGQHATRRRGLQSALQTRHSFGWVSGWVNETNSWRDGVMRWLRLLLVGGIVMLPWTKAAHAGVYSTLEPKPALNASYFRKFQEDTL